MRIKKILLIIGLLVGGLSVSNADEQNGTFVGLEIGNGQAQLKTDGGNLSGGFWNAKMNASSMVYGGKIGYKYFLNSSFGVRGYGSINFAEAKTKIDNNNISMDNKISSIIYALNADALFNFYNKEVSSIGAFLGIGIGGSSVSVDLDETGSDDLSGFYMDLKLGLRGNFDRNHEVEFIAKIPFIDAKKNYNGVDVKVRQNYIIALGYNFAF